MQKISQLPSPVVAGVVKERNAKAAIAEIKNCVYSGAEMIDLHMSFLEKTDVETLKAIISACPVPILALNYNQTFGKGDAGLTEEERIASFERAIEAGVAGIDMQGYTFHLPSKSEFLGEDKYSFTKNNPKEVVTDEEIIKKQCELIEKAHSKGCEVLLSCHTGIPMKSEQVVDLVKFLRKRNPDVIKLVTKADTEEDLSEGIRTMLELKKEIDIPVSFHLSGKMGKLSRIINPLLGGHIVFCNDRYKEESTMEQLDLKTAKMVVEGVKKLTMI